MSDLYMVEYEYEGTNAETLRAEIKTTKVVFDDRLKARRIYHEQKIKGMRVAMITIKDAETDDFADDYEASVDKESMQ